MSESNLVNSTACLILRFRRPGIKRKLTDDQFKAEDAEKALVDGSKKIIDSPEYQQIAAYESSVKHFLRSKALPSSLYRDSTYLIPLTSMKTVDEFLTKAEVEWRERVDAFLSVYEARKEETKKRLGAVADEADYLSKAALEAAFSVAYEYVTLSTPSTLKQVSAALYEREEERLKLRLRSAEEDIIAKYREQFSGMVKDMQTMLSGDAEEGKKAKRFSGWKVGRLVEYVEKFRVEQNVCGDTELATIMGTASQLLQGVDPKELKSDEKWRQSLTADFAALSKTLGELTQVKGTRQILDEEEDVA